MSKTIDERVVSMRFDNKQFESNVQTSLSTLDKLKRALKLDDASKGLEKVSSTAKNVDMSSLSKGVETVSTKFSALQVAGVTALANITNSAVNAAKNFVSALTIAPITDGFQEYEMTLNAIQTTMAGTGKTVKEVEAELKKLDEYADKTVYSTSDMLNNLPKFTNAGVELEKATTAMIGIANATALAGGDAGKASIAFYNLGQAIGTGYLTRMDYNSINNAGIATMEWKEQMVEAALAAGTLTKAGDDLYAAGDKTYTMQQLFIDGLQKQWATTDVLMKVFGDYGDETTAIGKKAYSAAQDIKTFSQMMESLKATAGTGWKDTWQLVFGGLDEAKVFWTNTTNFISGIINKAADFRNKIVGMVMGNPLSALADKITGITDTVKSAVKPLKQYADVVDRIIRGDFGNQGDNGDKNYRKKRVEAEGYDYATAQTLVNEKLGVGVKLTKELKGAQEEQSKTQSKSIDQLAEMSEKQLKALGYTDDQIEAIKTLAKYAEDAGVPLSKFIENIDKMSGREMLIESFKNAGKGLATVFKSVKDAFLDAFPISAESIALRIYSAITRIYEFSKKLDISKNSELIDKLTRSFKGLFAALDIITTVVGGPIKILFKIIGQLLGAVDLDILSVTAAIGDAIVKFRDWLESVLDFTGVFKWVAPHLQKAIDAVKNWLDAVKPFEKVANLFKKVADAVEKFAKSVWDSDITQNIVSGLTNGLKNGAKAIWDAAVNLGKKIIDAVKNILGIHSPSTEFFEIGQNIIEGLLNGLRAGIVAIGNAAKTLCSKLFGAFENVDLSGISTIFYNIFRLFPQLKILNGASALLNIFQELGGNIADGLSGGIASGAGKVWDTIVSMATGLIDAFKNVLGIHSPSKVFFTIGGFIIAGLIGGILGQQTNVFDALKSFGQGIANFFSGLDLGTVIAASGALGALLLVRKLLKIGDKFATAAENISALPKSIANLADTLNKKLLGELKPSKWTTISNAILKFAIAIGILVASVVIMSKIDKGDLWGAIGALAVIAAIAGMLAGIIAGLMYATKFIAQGDNVGKIGNTILKIAAALAIMVLVAKSAAKLSPEQLMQGSAAVLAFSGIIVGLMAATKLLTTGPNVDKIGRTLFKVSAAIAVMLIVAKMAAKMTPEDLVQGTLAIVAFSGIIVGLMAATKLLSGSMNVDKIGSTLFKVSAAIAIMLIVAKMAARMSPEDLVQGTLAIVAFSGIIVGLMAATKLINGSKNVGAIGGTILKIAGAIAIMIIVAKIAASMEPEELIKGTIAIVTFGGIIVALMYATKLINGSKNIDKIGSALFKIAGAIAIMMVVAKIAASMSVGDLVKGTLAIAAFGGIIVGLMAATKLIAGSKNVGKIGTTILMMAGAIAIMAASAALLSLVKPERLVVATAALGVLMGMFALVAKSASNITSSMGSLIVMTAAIAVMAGALAIVAILPAEQALAAAGSLALVMLAMSGVMLILSKMQTNIANVILGAVGLLALCVPLLALVGVLALMQNVQNAAANALVLAGLATVLTLLLIPLSVVGVLYTATGGMAMLGIVGLLAMCVPLLALVGILALMQGIQNAAESTKALTTLMTVMTGMLVVLAVVGPLALVGVAAMASLTTLIAAVGVFAVAVGALMQQFPALQSFLDTGIKVMIQIAGGIGEMIGAFVGGIATQLAASLPTIGLCLSQFIVNAMPFITGIKMVDDTVLKGVGIMAAAVLALTAADLISGIASFLQGGSSFATLGTELSMFMMNAMPFIAGSRAIDPEIMTGVKTLAEAILILCGSNMLETITGWLGGESSLSKFGSQLGQLGSDLNTFVTNLGTFTEAQVTTVTCAANAIKALADAASTIPNEGGLWAAIVGENSLATFSSSLPKLGSDLAAFITNLGTFDDSSLTTVKVAGDAIKALAEASGSIPNEGGLWAAIVGDNGLASFSSALPQLGKDLNGFITNLGTFEDGQLNTVKVAGEAIKSLASAANGIPNEGGFWAKLAGDNSLATFGSKLPQLGTDLKNFVANLGEFSESGISSVNAACKAIKALAALGKSDLDFSKIPTLGDKMVSLGKKIATFADKMSEISGDSLDSAITKVKDLVSFAQTVASTNIESLSTFTNSLKDVATDGVKGFVEAFTGESPKSKVKKAAETLLKAFITGAKDKKKDVKDNFEKIASAAADKLDSNSVKKEFKQAGRNLVTGFAEGITAQTFEAEAKAKAMAKAAKKAAEEALGIASPSKVFYGIGEFAGMGFINAFGDYEAKAGRAGSGLADSSIKGLKNAMARVTDVINSDIDAQPTIRPVLDLSNVQSGASAINGMFAGRRTLAVSTSTVGSISASMAGYQNGRNSDDVVSAIRGLRKDISDMPRNTYSIGGITYDDGSNIAEAVQSLVRAARVERRS